MKYHIVKRSRVYHGLPYRGPTSCHLPAQTDSLEDARLIASAMTNRNPVGWDIYDSETKERVE